MPRGVRDLFWKWYKGSFPSDGQTPGDWLVKQKLCNLTPKMDFDQNKNSGVGFLSNFHIGFTDKIFCKFLVQVFYRNHDSCAHTHTHTHRHWVLYIYIFIYIYMKNNKCNVAFLDI